MALAMQKVLFSGSLCSPKLNPVRAFAKVKVSSFSPLSTASRNKTVKASAEAPPPPPSAEVPPPQVTPPSPPSPPNPTFESIMAFNGVPEIVNGRLAMLGFAVGAFLELHNKMSFPYQLSHNGILYFGLATVLISTASVIPALKGTSPAKASIPFFSQGAEIINGRVAMLGLVGIVLLESLGKFSLGSL